MHSDVFLSLIVTLPGLERHLVTGGDLARLGALKAAALALAAQPQHFGLEVVVVCRLFSGKEEGMKPTAF